MGTLLQMLLAVTVVMLMLTESAYAFSCYQCNSTLDHNCQEKFEETIYNSQKSQECQMYNAQYCIKVTGLWGGIVGTHRFCSSRDLGDQCQDMRFPDHSRKYRGCIYTCSGDSCNSASSLFSTSILIGTAVCSLCAMFLR